MRRVGQCSHFFFGHFHNHCRHTHALTRTPASLQIEEHSSDEDKKKTVNQYTVHEVLGRGAFGVVRRVTSKQDGHRQSYAMKEMSKKMLQRKKYGVGNAPMRNAMEDVKKEVCCTFCLASNLHLCV